MKYLVAALLTSLSLGAKAGIVYKATNAVSQVTLTRDATGVTSCGMRITVAAEVGGQIRWYDFSGSAYRSGMLGLWKTGSYVITKKSLANSSSFSNAIRKPAPIGFWIAEADEQVPVTVAKVIPADDVGFVLGRAEFISTLKVLLAVAAGNKAQFSMRYKDEKSDSIVSFSSPLSNEDFATLIKCTEGLQQGLQDDSEGARE